MANQVKHGIEFHDKKVFVINYILNILTVASLLIVAFAALNDAQQGTGFHSNTRFRRFLETPDVSSSVLDDQSQSSPLSNPQLDSYVRLQDKKPAPVELVSSPASIEVSSIDSGSLKSEQSAIAPTPAEEEVTVDATQTTSTAITEDSTIREVLSSEVPRVSLTNVEPQSRQTRATTLTKQHTTRAAVSEIDSTTTLAPSTMPTVSADDIDDGEAEKLVKQKKKKKKKKRPVVEMHTNDEEEDEEAIEEKEVVSLKKPKHHYDKNDTSGSEAVTVVEANGESSTFKPKIKSKPVNQNGPATLEAPTAQMFHTNQILSVKQNLTPKVPIISHQKPTTSLTQTIPLPGKQVQKVQTSHQKQTNESDYEEEYEDEVLVKNHLPSVAAKHHLDISKVKLVGLNQWNESSMAKPNLTQQVATTVLPIDKENLPVSSSAASSQSISSNASSQASPLHSRSPPVQASGFAKRITNLINDSKSKLVRNPTSTTSANTTPMPQVTTNNPSSVTKFAYNKPYSTTMTLVAPTPINEKVFVQVVNQSDPNNQLHEFNPNENLDWSKFVKVVFKSAKDNHTVYTLVMNSSELSHHPINDWSHELPSLLQNDVEKLIQKWSNVFPSLMSDIGEIIINKVNSSLPSSASVHVASKLNETLSIKTNKPATTNNSSSSSSNTRKLGSLTNHQVLHDIINSSTPDSLISSQSGVNNLNASGQPTYTTNNPNSIQIAATTEPFKFFPVGSNAGHLSNGSFLGSITSTMNSTSASPKPFEVSADYIKSITPWSSSIDLSNSIIRTGNGSNSSQVTNNSHLAASSSAKDLKNRLNITGSGRTNSTLNAIKNVDDKGDLKSNYTNKSIVELMRDMNEEHSKIEDHVKGQADSLRHFIIICSVLVVIATSLAVALIGFLNK